MKNYITNNSKKKKSTNLNKYLTLKVDYTPEEKEIFCTFFTKKHSGILDSYINSLLEGTPLKATDKTKLYLQLATCLLATELFKLQKDNAKHIAKTLFVDIIKFIELGFCQNG